MGARKRREAMLEEAQPAGVLEPLDAVVRLQQVVVERVAVRHQHIGVAVLVQIDQIDPRRAPVGVRGGAERARAELERRRCAGTRRPTRALAQQREDVGPAVGVEVIAARESRRPWSRTSARTRAARRAGAILEQRQRTRPPPAEQAERNRGRVAVDVRRARIATRPSPLREQDGLARPSLPRRSRCTRRL